ncbi:MAG: NCS2 family permease [Rikenellaceae bacterium]
MLEKIFKLKERGVTPKNEVIGGVTTFMTMAYILAVNPAILSATGMDSGALFTATAVSSAVACILMGLLANLPIALAPGMGINAFFAYTIVLFMGYTWEMALAAVFVEGLIFILLSLCNIRELILKSIPAVLRSAIGVGIGLFIATVGLINAGVITKGEPISHLGDISEPSIYLTLIAVVILGALIIKKVPGGLLLGMVVTTLIAIPLGVVTLPENFSILSMPSSIEPLLFKMDFSHLWSLDMAVVIFTLIFSDLFDTAGTFIAVCNKAHMVDENGNVKGLKRAFLSDAIATTFGATIGASTVTTYAESAAGIAAGGRTGLTAVVTGVMFIVALFFGSLFSLVPSAATAAVLVVVGLLMMSEVTNIDFENLKYALPAFITILFIPLTYNIANGISYGFLSYVLIHVMVGKYREVSPVMYILALLFVAKIFL